MQSSEKNFSICIYGIILHFQILTIGRNKKNMLIISCVHLFNMYMEIPGSGFEIEVYLGFTLVCIYILVFSPLPLEKNKNL